jgi:hypothetical protein
MSNQAAFSIDDCVMAGAQVIGPGHYVFIAHSEKGLQRNEFICRAIEFDRGDWRLLVEWAWQAVALRASLTLPLQVDVLGRDGQLGTWTSHKATLNHVELGRPVGPFRGMRELRGKLLAYGMKREIFQREPDNTWTRFNEGMDAPKSTKKLSIAEKMKARLSDLGGINSISVYGTEDFVAFGMRGEIWNLRGIKWARVDSPTNLMLKDSATASDLSVYVCGQSGALLKGGADIWQVVDYKGPEGLDFCSICVFDGLVYIADGHSLRVLDEDELRLVDFGTEDIVPCALVVSGPGRILSIAGQEIWESADGRNWTCLLG